MPKEDHTRFHNDTSGRLPLWFEQELPPHHCRLVDGGIHVDPSQGWALDQAKRAEKSTTAATVQKNMGMMGGWHRPPQWVGRSKVLARRHFLERFGILLALASWTHPRARHIYRSTEALNAERRRHMRQRFAAIHPFSPASYYWTLITAVATAINIVWIPCACLKYTILVSENEPLEPMNVWHLPNFIIDCIFIADLFFGYFTGVCDDVTSEVFFDRRTRLRHTLLRQFLQSLACMPFSWFASVNFHTICIYGYLLRIFHMRRFFACIDLLLQRKPQMISFTYCCIIRAVLIPLITIHWAGIYALSLRLIFYGYCEYEHYKIHISTADLWECDYFAKFCHTFTSSSSLLFSMWHGLIFDTCQIIPVTGLIIIGRIMFLYVFVQIATVVRINYGASRKIMGKVTQLEEFMEYRDLPPVQRQRLLTYFSFCFSKLSFRESAVLNFISGNLKEDIQMHRCKEMVANVELFQTLPMHVIVRIVVRLSMEIFMSNEIVVLAGTQGTSMYFISTGTVVVYSSTGREICHLNDGAHFGEIALLSGEQTRIASVVAAEACELYVLRRDAFLDAVAKFPQLLEMVQETALKRIEETVALDRKSWRLTTLNRANTGSSEPSSPSKGTLATEENLPNTSEIRPLQDIPEGSDIVSVSGNEPEDTKETSLSDKAKRNK